MVDKHAIYELIDDLFAIDKLGKKVVIVCLMLLTLLELGYNSETLVHSAKNTFTDFWVGQRKVSDCQLLDLFDARVMAVLESYEVCVDHAVEEDVLKWEVYLHFDAVSQVIEDLD